MFCKECGTKIPENASFCPNCGTLAEAPAAPEEVTAPSVPVTPVYAEPVQPTAPVNTTPILVMGIISLVCTCTFWFSFVGIIFGAIGCGKAKTLLNSGYPITGKAKVGKILSKVGLIVSIVLTVLAVIYIFAIIIMVIAAAEYGNNNIYNFIDSFGNSINL